MSFVPPNVTDTAYGYMLGKNWKGGSAAPASSKMDTETKAMHEWKGYAMGLEVALREQKIESRGQFLIKEAALKEIARIDPNNPLLKVEVRKAIFDKAEESLKKDGRLD